jgi:DMSO/TMAO reductase YedYZ heme-binding membrane subunit
MWYIGLIIALSGNFISSFGPGFNKYGLKYNSDNMKRWSIIYYSCIIAGFLGDLVGLYFASPSIIVPCAGIIFLSNYIISRFVFNESVNSLYPTISIMLFIILLIIITGSSNCTENCSLLNHWYQLWFLIYAVIVTSVIVFLFFYLQNVKREIELQRLHYEIVNETVGEVHYRKLDDNKPHYINGICMCIIAGFFSSCSILCLKIIMELFNIGLNSTSIIITFTLTCILLVLSFVIQQKYYNEVLTLFDLSFCVPIFQCALIGYSTLSSILLFEEYKSYNIYQQIGFPLSLLGTIISCLWLWTVVNQEQQLKFEDFQNNLLIDVDFEDNISHEPISLNQN